MLNLQKMNSEKYIRYEQDYSKKLETIKEQYLLKHFQQIVDVLDQNYRYAFNLIKYLYLVKTSKLQIILNKVSFIVQNIINRKKKSVLLFLLRKVQTNKYWKSRSCICLVSLLDRRTVILFFDFMTKLKQLNKQKQTVPKDKKCFLLIKISNLNKLFSIKKSEGFYAILSQSILGNRLTILSRLFYILSNLVNRQVIDGYQNISGGIIASIKQQKRQHISEQSNSDTLNIWIESYKNMAQNIRRIDNKKSSNLTQIKHKIILTNLFAVLSYKLRQTLQWSYCDILCLDNHHYKLSNLSLLQKEIVLSDLFRLSYRNNTNLFETCSLI